MTAGPLLYLANRSDSLVVVGLLTLISIGVAAGAYYVVGLAREQRTLLKTTFRQAVGLRGAAYSISVRLVLDHYFAQDIARAARRGRGNTVRVSTSCSYDELPP